MRLFTVQDRGVYDTLLRNGVVYPNDVVDEDFKQSYNWIAQQMVKRIGDQGRNSLFPFWAWTSIDDINTNVPVYVMELEVPDHLVLKSCFVRWHTVLNEECGAIFDKRAFNPKTSWWRIFREYEDSWQQACFWEMRLEYLRGRFEIQATPELEE